MQINKTGPALYAMQKALAQPKMLLALLQKSVQADQKLAAAQNSAPHESDVAVLTGKGQQINLVL